MTEKVDHPRHYNLHPSGVEAITVCEHMGFNLGNAMKYIWRADHKGAVIEDLKKARWYVDREIQKREKEAAAAQQAKEETAARALYKKPPQWRVVSIKNSKPFSIVRPRRRRKA